MMESPHSKEESGTNKPQRIAAWSSLLDDSARLPKQGRPRTMLEIAGVADRERVASNILAYFLDPAKDHGLGTLVLRSLLEVAGYAPALAEGGARVTQEEQTSGGKFLDIVVKTPAAVIGIENKIYAALRNPLTEYQAELSYRARRGVFNAEEEIDDDTSESSSSGAVICPIVLSLFPLWGDAGCPDGTAFQNVTYASLFARVMDQVRHHLTDAAPARLALLLDFVRTTEYLQQGTHMEPEFLDLVSKRRENVHDFLWQVVQLRRELKQLASAADRKVGLPKGGPVEMAGIWRPPHTLFHRVFRGVRVRNGLVIGADLEVDAGGWGMSLFTWDLGHMDAASAWLREHRFEVVDHPRRNEELYKNRLTIPDTTYAYAEINRACVRFRQVVQNIIDAADAS